MPRQADETAAVVSGPEPGRFRPDELSMWLPACATLGILVANAAVVASLYFAPLLLFPLMVGVVLGGAAILVMRANQVGHRPTIWVGILLAAILTVTGQHYFSFLFATTGNASVIADMHFRALLLLLVMAGTALGWAAFLLMRANQIGHRPAICAGIILALVVTVGGELYFLFQEDQSLSAEERQKEHQRERGEFFAHLRLVAPERTPPARFWDYIQWSAAHGRRIGTFTARGGLAWLAWSIDALLVVLPAFVLVGSTARLPYCNRCRRWFQTVRSGRLDSATAAILAGLAAIEAGLECRRARYRVLACQGGCGPTGFVLSWDDPAGRLSSGIVWLDARGYRQVVEVLDDRSRRDGRNASDAEHEEANAENRESKTET